MNRIIIHIILISTILVPIDAISKEPDFNIIKEAEERKIVINSDLCMRANTQEISDLCQQWRMANSADRQVTLIEEQNKITVISFYISAFAAILSMTALFISIYSERRQSKIQSLDSRAYLKAKIIKFRLNLSGDKRCHIVVQVENVGKTIASNVFSRAYVDFLDVDTDSDITFPFADFEIHGSRSLMPGEMILQNGVSAKEVTDDIIEKIDAKRLHICTWGKVSYKDMFNKRHDTTYSVYHVFHESIRKFLDPKHSEEGQYLFFNLGNHSD